jgi:hypothetical protein
MQIDALLQFRTICRSTHYDHFVPYAKSYEDSTFILILHHIQINVIPKYMLHVGTVKSMYLRWGEKTEQKKYTCILCYCVLSYILSLNHLLLMSLC